MVERSIAAEKVANAAGDGGGGVKPKGRECAHRESNAWELDEAAVKLGASLHTDDDPQLRPRRIGAARVGARVLYAFDFVDELVLLVAHRRRCRLHRDLSAPAIAQCEHIRVRGVVEEGQIGHVVREAPARHLHRALARCDTSAGSAALQVGGSHVRMAGTHCKLVVREVD